MQLCNERLISQLEKYPRQKVSLLTEYFLSEFRKDTAGSIDNLLSARDLTNCYGVSKVTALKVLDELTRRMSGKKCASTRILRGGTRKKVLVCSDSLAEREKFFTYNLNSFTVERERAMSRLVELGLEPELIFSGDLAEYDFDRMDIGGILVKGGRTDLIKAVAARGIPVVQIQIGTVEPSFVHSVATELLSADMEILDMWQSRRRILACVLDERISRERFESFFYAAECRNMGDRIHPVFSPMITGDLGQLAGYKRGLQIIETEKNPCIFSGCDYFSFGLVSAFMEHNWLPKRDYELISADNLEELNQQPFGEPILTTIDTRRLELYDLAAELLADLIRNRAGYEKLITMRCKARLIRRKTA
jgi:DNA-binding LacI/PurR family transcriptional regulator